MINSIIEFKQSSNTTINILDLNKITDISKKSSENKTLSSKELENFSISYYK